MASLLGKRKRTTKAAALVASSKRDIAAANAEENAQELQDIFRRAFEAKFKPLVVEPKAVPEDVEGSEDDTESEDNWNGLSADDDEEEEGPGQVQVVEHGTIAETEVLTRAEMKAFMSSKVPTNASKTTHKVKSAAEDDDEPGEKLNLKKDLELQRLINESHLLHPDAKPSNQHRQKLLDMRLQTLGSKTSMLKQDKMPMSHRKGITARATDKEARRRQEAKENGIILEKAAKTKKPEEKRERGVGAPNIGKFKAGTLRLSKQDLSGMKGKSRR